MENEAESKDENRISVHIIPPIGPYAENLIPLLEKKPELRVIVCQSMKDAFEGVQKEPNSIVLLHVYAKEQIKGLLSILKASRRLLSKGKLVTIIKFKHPELHNILMEYGCQDIIDESNPGKTVIFKIDKIARILSLQIQNQRDQERGPPRQGLPADRGVNRESDGKAKTNFQMLEPLKLASDCFIFQEGSVHKIMGRITVRMQGPPPTSGRWLLRSFKEKDGKEYSIWAWNPSNPVGVDPFILEPGAWHYVGNRPDFIDLQWIFSGNPMELRFVVENEVVCRKLIIDPSGVLKIASNSATTLSFGPRIEESLDKLVRLTADQQEKDKKTGIKKDQDEAVKDAVFEQEAAKEGMLLREGQSEELREINDKRRPEAVKAPKEDTQIDPGLEKPRELRDKRGPEAVKASQKELHAKSGTEKQRELRDRRGTEIQKTNEAPQEEAHADLDLEKRGKPRERSPGEIAKADRRAKEALERQHGAETERGKRKEEAAELEEKRAKIRAEIEAARKKKRAEKEQTAESEADKGAEAQDRKIQETCEAVIELAKERAVKELIEHVKPERAREIIEKRDAEIDKLKKHAEEKLAAEPDPAKQREIREKLKETTSEAKATAEKALCVEVSPEKVREIQNKKEAQIEKVKKRAEEERTKRRDEEKRKREVAKEKEQSPAESDEEKDEGRGVEDEKLRPRQLEEKRKKRTQEEKLIQTEVAKMMARLPIGPGKPRLSPFSIAILMSNWLADGSRTPLEVAYLFCSASRAVLGDVDAELWIHHESDWSCVAKSHVLDSKFRDLVAKSKGETYKEPDREAYVFPIINQAKKIIGAFAIESKPKNEFAVANFEAISELGVGILESQIRTLDY